MDKLGDHEETSGPGVEDRAWQLPELEPLYAVNARCIEMLVQAARADRPSTLPLVQAIREELMALTSEARSRAARCPILLVDMQFADFGGWRFANQRPTPPGRVAAWRGAFPRVAGAHLARITLMLAWHLIRLDQQMACLFLGMTPPVAGVLAGLSVTEVLQVAEVRFRHARPRWEDRPWVWRRLILAAESGDMRKVRDFDVYSVQLITGERLSPTARI
jgi:hypothetical protein